MNSLCFWGQHRTLPSRPFVRKEAGDSRQHWARACELDGEAEMTKAGERCVDPSRHGRSGGPPPVRLGLERDWMAVT
jgi:hypothetical protein